MHPQLLQKADIIRDWWILEEQMEHKKMSIPLNLMQIQMRRKMMILHATASNPSDGTTNFVI